MELLEDEFPEGGSVRAVDLSRSEQAQGREEEGLERAEAVGVGGAGGEHDEMRPGLEDPRGLRGEIGWALGGVEGAGGEDEVDGRGGEGQAAVVPRDGERRGRKAP